MSHSTTATTGSGYCLIREAGQQEQVSIVTTPNFSRWACQAAVSCQLPVPPTEVSESARSTEPSGTGRQAIGGVDSALRLVEAAKTDALNQSSTKRV